jgi:hypothetical protein
VRDRVEATVVKTPFFNPKRKIDIQPSVGLQQAPELPLCCLVGRAPRFAAGVDTHFVARTVLARLDHTSSPTVRLRLGQDPISTTLDVKLS